MGHLIRTFFNDSKIVETYSKGRTKVSYILYGAIKPGLQLTQIFNATTSSETTDSKNFWFKPA